VILPLFKRDLLPPFWGISKLGQKPGIWAILTLAWNLYMERYLGFWGLAKIGGNLIFGDILGIGLDSDAENAFPFPGFGQI
jgi:hypothetical protein